VPVRAKLSDELHLQSDQSQEIAIPRAELATIRYSYTEYAPFPLEVLVLTVSGEVFSFGLTTFAPVDGYLTSDNCVEEKSILLTGVNASYPHEEVSVDLGLSMVPDEWADPYRIDAIEFR
jgi:hypothetical protein